MITSKKTDGTYGEIGFIKAKQEDGSYKDIEYQYDNKGNLIFEKGFTRSKEGALPLVINGIGRPLKDYTIYGNAYQSDGVSSDTPQEVVGVGDRTGNLFNGEIMQGGLGDSNGAIATSSSRVRTTKINVTENTYYTITSNLMIRNVIAYNNDTFVSRLVGSTSNIAVFSIPVGVNQIAISFKGNQEGTVEITPNDLEWLMINEGSTPLPYEPYGYKVDVVSRGKNLIPFPYYDSDQTINGVTFTTEDDGQIVANGTAIGTVRFYLMYDQKLKAGTYTLSVIRNAPIANINLQMFDSSKGLTSDGLITTIGGSTSESVAKTFTLNEDTNVHLLYAKSGLTETYIDEYVQLETGSTATEYEPYTPPITTPIYLDSPLYSDDVLSYLGQKVTRGIKELILTGEEDWVYGRINEHNVFRAYLAIGAKTNNVEKCTHYIARYTNSDNSIYVASPTETGRVVIVDDRLSSVDDFKSFLATQYSAGTPVTVYYVLAEPETKTVEPVEIPTLDGTTVIDVDTEVKPSAMYVKYKSSK